MLFFLMGQLQLNYFSGNQIKLQLHVIQ